MASRLTRSRSLSTFGLLLVLVVDLKELILLCVVSNDGRGRFFEASHTLLRCPLPSGSIVIFDILLPGQAFNRLGRHPVIGELFAGHIIWSTVRELKELLLRL